MGAFLAGLSPRLRGNLDNRVDLVGASGSIPASAGNLNRCLSGMVSSGSIPASAGEPFSASSRRRRKRVYPRVCGGTVDAQVVFEADEGLSPRLRGNPGLITRAFYLSGSIPASAGEPNPFGCIKTAYRVYPRVCGGTSGF